MTAPAGVARVLVVEHQATCPLGRLDPLPGCATEVVRPYRGEPLPADLAGYDGLVVLGGEMDSWDDDGYPWLPSTRVLLAQAVDRGVPALGVCLGAQLLALATGGHVARGERGPELGLREVALLPAAADDALAGTLPATVAAPQGHLDAVHALPPDAVVLASSDLYPHQLFRVGSSAWGVQYHPEVTEADFAVWMANDHDLLAAQGRTPEQEVAALVGARAELDASARSHAQAFADVVLRTRTPAVTG
ncbi:type 1 glutamine amidotransferase [Angustibacter speluncae]